MLIVAGCNPHLLFINEIEILRIVGTHNGIGYCADFDSRVSGK